MSEIIFTANIILPMFFLFLVGAGCMKIGIINGEFVKKGNKLSFTILLPVMLFLNIYNSKSVSAFDLKFACILVGGISALFVCSWGILWLVYKNQKRKLPVLIQACFRSNFVLFGTYLMTSLYGEHGVLVVSCYMALVVGLFNVFATFILEFYSEKRKSGVLSMLKQICKNPLIIASVLGVVVNVANVNFGTIVESTLQNIASIATVFSMICLGANLKLEKLKMDKWNILLGTFLRLIVAPLVGCGLIYAFGYRGEMFAVSLIVFATPVAVSSYIMAQEQGADDDLAGGIVASTTLFSILSLFVIILLAKVIGII